MIARKLLARSVLAVALGCAGAPAAAFLAVPAMAASEIAVIVNKEPVTSYQIRQRAAFMKLRREAGNVTAKATDELIDEALKRQEIRRRGIAVPDEAVEQAFEKFAAENKLTTAQLSEIFSRAGFSTSAFKDYIRVQMGWGQAVQANMRRQERISEQDMVRRMLEQGGEKPTTTEYTLQQVIFVIPTDKRAALKDRRMKEANALRSRFKSCANTYQFAKGLRDVTVRELGRVAQPELPTLWKEAIQETRPGSATPPKETDRGVEFIAVCDARRVSDDLAAAMVFQERDLQKLGKEEPDAKLLGELKKKAQIVRR